jgi:uncharacterized protein YndB with AHSA1/START domain
MLSSANAEPVCLLIADISGYTSYLAGVELDHAQDILADLIGTVVTALRPTFKLAKLEGDAAFVFAPAEKIDGSVLLDTIERCYFGFRRRRRDVRQATSCECNACVRIPDLNLKFVTHHGQVLRQRIAGREELLGSDVIVVHRLLKNTVAEQRGLEAYAVFTQACVDAMDIEPEPLGMSRQVETYDVIGEVPIWVHDLEARWQEEDERARVRVAADEALFQISIEVTAPPQVVWEFVTTPGRRLAWQHTVTDVVQTPRKGGRRGVGTVNHCMHGADAVVEEILDWRPFDYITDRSTMPGGGPTFMSTFELEPTPTGTIVHARFSPPRTAKERAMMEQMAPMFLELMQQDAAALSTEAAAEAERRSEGRELEPELPRPKPDGLFSELTGPLQIVG